MTEAQFVKKLVSQGTSTDNFQTKKIAPSPKAVGTKMPPKRGLKLLLEEIDKNAATFVPEPDPEKRQRNPLPWEHGMIAMMQDLKGTIDKDSEHYKALKEGLLTTRRDFITGKEASVNTIT